MKSTPLFTIVVVLIATVGVWWFFGVHSGVQITTFEECVAAGNPVMESYPRQCRAGGQTFTEFIGNELGRAGLIRVNTPRPNQAISSPLTITGEARGNWYFEASFPVRIEDTNGNVLGQHYATAQGEWMIEDFVPFQAELSFVASQTKTGVLILEKDNPSGLPENADELRIPIQFGSVGPQRTVKLYYYNPSKDEDASGNIMCSRQGLVAVERTIPITQTPIQDAVRLLLSEEITSAEAAQGITTEYPLPGFELQGASLVGGILTLGFSDPNNSSSGGSCRSGILWFQIEETAKQFDDVEEVRFQPEDLFQP